MHDGRDVRTAYDTWAPTYDGAPNRTRDLDATVFRAQPFDLQNAVVVEAGCGTGKNTQWLAQRARCVIGLDFSEPMLAVARSRRYPADVRFVAADVRARWPLADGTADVVTCNLVLEHVQHIEPVVAEAARVVRAGGLLYLSEFHPARQLLGKQARFRSGEREILVAAFAHDVSDFVRAGTAAGLRLTALQEWRDDDRDWRLVPRLLTLTFVKWSQAAGVDPAE